MKILLVSLSNRGGGASRATQNLADSLYNSKINFELIIFEGEKIHGCTTKILDNWFDTFVFRLINKIFFLFGFFLKNPSKDLRSFNIFPTKLLNLINTSDADIVHLHWIGAEMISIKQLSLIKKPIVWSLHDGWIFNGTYHINPKEFYPFINRFNNPFIERFFINRKKKYLQQKPIFFTSPSQWLIEEFNHSYFDKTKSSCRFIPNIIDKNKWIGIDKLEAKNKFGLPLNKKCILFGANNADTSLNKGYDFFKLLVNALPPEEYCFLVVGNKSDIMELYMNVFCVGQVKSIDAMIDAYSAADISLIPSLSENLPYVALESILCNTPVLAFNTGGMKNVVFHKKNGYLVDKFNLEDLINGVKYLATHNFKIDLAKTLVSYDESKVIRQYIDLYDDILKNK